MAKKKKSEEQAFGPHLLKNPVVQKALADMAVAAVLAIAARIEGSKLVRQAESKAGKKLVKAVGAEKAAKSRSKPKKAKLAS
jgi:alkylation response protein AidB-like acyl-CoA dehydrogenase